MIQTRLDCNNISKIEFEVPEEAFLQKYVKDGRNSLYVKGKRGRAYPARCPSKKPYSQIEPGDWVWVTRTQKPGSHPTYDVKGWFPSKENPKDITISTVRC